MHCGKANGYQEFPIPTLLGVWVFCWHAHMACALCVYVPSTIGGQQKVSEPLGLEKNGCELPHGCYELNPSPLEELQFSLPMDESSG